MNPGVFVMGGGAGAGGGNGKNGQAGAGRQGAGGENGGQGANGGGKGAGACGPGSGGGCMNPVHGGNGGTHAGDPVDPVSGRVYTTRETDVPLVGPLVFALQRAYSSSAHERDIGLGHGWSHSLAWSLVRHRRSLEVHAPFGAPVRHPLAPDQETLTVRGVGTFRIGPDFIVLADEEDVLYRFEATSSEPVRSYRLTEIFDRARNVISLNYDPSGALVWMVDSAGRGVTVRRSADGRISRFEIRTSHGRALSYRSYEYDARGDLVAVLDAEGRRVRYAYDQEHRLTEQRFPSGRCVHYRYDARGRCVESWVDHGGAPDPALADAVPSVLADGITKAKGMLHVRLEYEEGTTTVFDSRQTRRFDHNAHGTVDLASGVWVETMRYDEQGRMIAYAGPNGNVTRYERGEDGRVSTIVDPTGATNQLRHDAAGYLVEAVDSLGHAISYVRDGAGNLLETTDALGLLLRCTYDARGLRLSAEMPNGALTRFEHDAQGNLVRLIEPNGRAKAIEVDDIGRIIGFTDEEGYRTAYHYDAMGVLQSITLPNGAVTSVEHDADGHIAAYHTPDGATWRMHWAGHHMVYRLDKPNGESIHYRYDREGQLVQIANERGEIHTLNRDVAGRVVAETFFDGRRYDYKLDAAGQLAAHRNGAGERTEIERDAAGRVVKRTYDDGSEESFEYDSEGRLVVSDTGDVTTSFAYDARGHLVKETSSVAGVALPVEYVVDVVGQLVERRSPAGGRVRVDRDLMGRATRIYLPDGGVIERTLDGLGREVLRTLPEGGSIVCSYDGMGALRERRVVGAHAARRGSPDWVGRLPEGTTFAEAFAVSRGGELLERTTSDGEREMYAYDALGRVVQRATRAGVERFAYDGSGRTHEVDGPARIYGSGGTPLRRGGEAYQYDAESRRVRKTDGAGGETRYEWNGRGLLSAVRLPDGTRVEYTYDTDGRLVLRRRSQPGGAVVETRFAWCQGLLFHEATFEIAARERRLVHERLYVHDDIGAPLAHRDTVHRQGQAVHQPWVHYVAGPADLPALLVAGDGTVLSRVRGSVWGAASFEGSATTPLRFLGQYFDEDTGLSYNRHRYYDPALGLFINADPSGLSGGTGAFEYARSQPYRYVDPLGLQPVTTTVTSSDGTITQTGHSTQHPNHSSPQGIHPVVWQSLPQRGAFYNQPGPDGRGGVGRSYPAGRPPHTCGEPHALTNYIRAWEQQHNGGQPLNPNNPRDREKIQQCLGSIGSISSQHDNGTPRAPCPNCSQLIANLQARWGAPATSAVQPGYDNAEGTGRMTNYTPPLPNYLGPRRRYR
ncbi:hypothetical protein BE17_18880 [Sorangium cellulosum]|uniref:Uncharacterized protein n=1 Tax=Sorangium cellulosum TaxID=56 RepID=A0A150SPW3_SORCE|nr:hypothetical protein BE17_18880 [Sorangium cellulosum]